MTTPALEAKEFARANGFSIEPTGRRYTVKRSASPECLKVVAEVGSYPAALNAMRKYIEAPAHADDVSADAIVGGCPCAPCGDGSNVKCPDPVTGRLGCDDAKTPGSTYAPIDAYKTDAQVAEDVTAMRGDAWARKTPGEILADLKECMADLASLPPVFDDFNEESKARIRAAASKLVQSSNEIKRPWQLNIDGRRYNSFSTRAAAVTESRSIYNKRLRYFGIRSQSSITYVGV